MKIIHVPYGFYPDSVGGTEVYVSALAREQIDLGHVAIVTAPGPHEDEYEHDSVPVRRFAATSQIDDVSQLYDEGDRTAAQGFARILDREQPDVVHLHAFTRACSVLLVREARARGIPVVFTYHTPTVSCARGTLMLWGATPCDGALGVARCAACALEAHGMARPLANLLGHIPPSRALASARIKGRAATALKFSSLVAMEHSATRALFDEVDRIVAFRGWVRALLVGNGVAESKIVSSSHALCHPFTVRPRAARHSPTLRVAFMGRIDPTKGVDVLIRALGMMPSADIVLDIYGTVQGEGGRRELERLRRLADGDRRVTFKTPVDGSVVIGTIAAYDVLAVPSQWMETGPLVVLEAFAAGVPVVGSALGGIGELVSDDVDGLLVSDFQSPRAWANAFTRLCNEPRLADTLCDGVRPPATMDRVASEMLGLYDTMIAPSARLATRPKLSNLAPV
ncbi:MAG TPA: glycosyltransferase [Vicinamibacterales bacterium]